MTRRSRGLSTLQEHVLSVLSVLTPIWTLTGGAALVGFHTHHRTTRDLDLRWLDTTELAGVARGVTARLVAAGLSCNIMQTGPALERPRVTDAAEVVIVDLIADPVPTIESPIDVAVSGAPIRVDTAHEILVDKLRALLGRVELRDLEDVRALLDAGGDLLRAVLDAPRRDAGFSLLTLAWAVRNLPVPRLAASAGYAGDEPAALEKFRDTLVDRLVAFSAPDDGTTIR
jgi:hypothetical protein